METLKNLRNEYAGLCAEITQAQKEYNQFNRVPTVDIIKLLARRRTINQILNKYYALEVSNAKSFLSWK